ncbi:hypothetical protein N1032_24115, partial [Herbiconiux sp. CPCC 203386]|nr:hypothetical protein [Herbiconiux daphne]
PLQSAYNDFIYWTNARNSDPMKEIFDYLDTQGYTVDNGILKKVVTETKNTAPEVAPYTVSATSANAPATTATTFAPVVTYVDSAPKAPAYIAPVAPVTVTPAAPVINAPVAPDYAAIAQKAKNDAMSKANTIGGRITSKASQQEPNLPATHTFTTLPAATPDLQPAAPVVYNSQSQKVNDHSQAVANIQGGKATAAGYITPPVYTAPAPQQLPVVAPATPSVNVPTAPVVSTVVAPTPVISNATPSKQTQGGGVWDMAPEIKGDNKGQIVQVDLVQHTVAAPRPTTPIIVNPDVMGQPVSTNTIAKPIALN